MTLRIAVVGAGYWGPNLVRNFLASPDWDLVAVCDLDAARARKAIGSRSTVQVETSLDALLARDDLDAVAIATPARTHRAIALAALEAGKHVLVEKPLAPSRAEAAEMIVAAERARAHPDVRPHLLLHAGGAGDRRPGRAWRARGHPVRRLGPDQPGSGAAGRRRALGPRAARPVDPRLHPPGGLAPSGVAAHGADPIGAGRACVGYLTMPLAGGAIAHVHVNWLSPTKIRQMVIGGSRKTVVWDDLEPAAAAVASTTAASTSTAPRTTPRCRSGEPSTSPTGSATCTRPSLPEREALRADGGRVRRGDPRGASGTHGRRGGSAGCCRCWRRRSESLACRRAPRAGRSGRCRGERRREPAAGRHGPGDRRGRHHRVDDRGPAPRRGRGPGRRAGQPGARPAGEPGRRPGVGAGHAGRGRHPGPSTSCTT